MGLPRRVLAAVACASALVFVALALVFAATSGDAGGVDDSPAWASALSVLGGPGVLPLLTIAAAAALALSGRRAAAWLVLAAVIGAGVLTYVLKGVLQVLGADHDGGRLSDFPSGHEATAVAFALALSTIAWTEIRGRAGRCLLIAVPVATAFAMGWSRVTAGAHSVVDVAGGAVLAVGWVAACLLAWPSRAGAPG
jgi:undecaprenyl-diphosphatase